MLEQELENLTYAKAKKVLEEMEKHRKKALDALSIFPNNKYKDSLIELLDYSINRMK